MAIFLSMLGTTQPNPLPPHNSLILLFQTHNKIFLYYTTYDFHAIALIIFVDAWNL